MRRRGHVDGNHGKIVAALREVGATVQSLAELGDGTPDLLVGFRRVTYLLEVKNPEQDANKRRLSAQEAEWHTIWRGLPVRVVETPYEALRAIGAIQPTEGVPDA